MDNKDYTALSVIAHTCPTIKDLVDWLLKNKSRFEKVTIEHWLGSMFYITVEDIRDELYKGAAAMRVGFTVDVSNDTIVYNDMQSGGCQGACFVRSPRWKGKFAIKHLGNSKIQHFSSGRNS